MQVKVNSTGGKGIKALLGRLEKGHVNVGILASVGQHEDSDLTVAQVGFYHEFGTVKTPERSFIRSTIEDKSKEIKKLARQQSKLVLNGKTTLEVGLGKLGAFTAGLIQEKFTSNDWPANTEATIALKGSSKPLIDSGQLRQSISYEVKV
jgi:hypothetical protein